MKILFIGNTRLGDAILSTSILNYYSGSNLNITVVCSPLTENIYKNFSNVKDIIAVNKKKRGNILQNNEDIDLSLNNMISNNDYLMIKGSNATGLNNFSKKMIKGI